MFTCYFPINNFTRTLISFTSLVCFECIDLNSNNHNRPLIRISKQKYFWKIYWVIELEETKCISIEHKTCGCNKYWDARPPSIVVRIIKMIDEYDSCYLCAVVIGIKTNWMEKERDEKFFNFLFSSTLSTCVCPLIQH